MGSHFQSRELRVAIQAVFPDINGVFVVQEGGKAEKLRGPEELFDCSRALLVLESRAITKLPQLHGLGSGLPG